jgi:predicted transport protein
MDVYSIKGNKLNTVELNPFKNEREIQDLVEKNTETLFGIEFISSEFRINEFRIDTLCFDNESNSFVIIEYKKGSSYSVIDQGYSYLSKMLNNKDSFILEYCRKKKVSVDVDVDWSQSRIIFVSPSFNSYQKNSVNFQDIPFELWEIKRFSNNTFVLNQQLSNSKENINLSNKAKTSKENSIIGSVSKEIKIYSEEDHLKKCDPDTRNLYFTLKNKILEWDNIRMKPMKKHIGFWDNKNMFVYFNTKQNSIKITLVKGYTGTKTEDFKLQDPKGLFKIFKNKWKELYQYSLKEEKNIDYLLMMIKQKLEF